MAQGHIGKRCGCTYTTPEGVRKQYGHNCPRLVKKDGGWNARHGVWYFSIGVTVRGKRKQILRSGFASQAEAQAALDKLKELHARGVQVTRRLTLGQYLHEWIDGKADIRPNTLASYRGQIERYMIPHLGHLRLDDLRTSDVADMLAHVTSSPAMTQRVRACLRSALNDAVRQGLIAANPASHVKLKSATQPRALVWTDERVRQWRETRERPSPVMVWTPAQLGEFLDGISTHRLYAMFWMLSHRGLRRGEALGLEWPDFDFDNGTVTIMRQRVSTRGKTYESEPKSEAGRRVVALGRDGVSTLRAHRLAQRKEQMAHTSWVDSGKVFTTPRGQALHPMNVTHMFRDLVADSGLPPIRLHDLRHGAASLMLASGVDMKTVQETLGHANLATTANVYTSVYPDVAQAAADAVAAIVPRAR